MGVDVGPSRVNDAERPYGDKQATHDPFPWIIAAKQSACLFYHVLPPQRMEKCWVFRYFSVVGRVPRSDGSGSRWHSSSPSSVSQN